MSSDRPTSRYARSNRWLHWIVFALVLLAYLCINLFELFPRGSAPRANMLGGALPGRLAVLLLVLPRLGLRMAACRAADLPPPSRWSELLGKLTHVALYAVPAGPADPRHLTLQIGGKAVALFGVTVLPALVRASRDRALAHQMEDIHGTIGTIFYYVIGLHILAALWHHFGRRDNTLHRML